VEIHGTENVTQSTGSLRRIPPELGPNTTLLHRPIGQSAGVQGDDELSIAESEAFRASVEDTSGSISHEDLKKKHRLV
jgi:hypothetical protein